MSEIINGSYSDPDNLLNRRGYTAWLTACSSYVASNVTPSVIVAGAAGLAFGLSKYI